MHEEMNPFDLLSGKVVQNRFGTIRFKNHGNDNVGENGWPDGILHYEDGPAWICPDGSKMWFINGKQYIKKDFDEKIKCMKK